MTTLMPSGEMDARVKSISAQLRCLVCQNQTIADSQSDLANDLRAQIQQQLQQGRSEGQVLEFMAERYGAYVLYKPPVNAATAALWAGPGLMLVGGGLVMAWVVRRRARVLQGAARRGVDEQEEGA